MHEFLRIAKSLALDRRESEEQLCRVAPSPGLQRRMRTEIRAIRRRSGMAFANRLGLRGRRRVGFNDGLVVPGRRLALGAPPSVARSVAARRAPLRRTLRVAVVLVEFPDKTFRPGRKKYFEDLFFSQGRIATGSVREYFSEVSNRKVKIQGQVVGPYRLPKKLARYAGGGSGIDNAQPNARNMARDAAVLANRDIDFARYDNDGDGFVDAYVVVHAGRGAEETGNGGDIWSHKWVLSGGALDVDGAEVYAYLTVPEDAKLGVCAHELGHLLFGFPDLYDIDGDSEGVGDWCLMGGGSWNGNGHTPAHPSAWCKIQQGWARVNNVASNRRRVLREIQASRKVWRLWKDGADSTEYFLAEFRAKTGFDKKLPGSGLLVWHIDDTVDGNSNQFHPQVRLLQADGQGDLEAAANRGDTGDPFPGKRRKRNLNATSNPDTLSYGGLDSAVAIERIVKVPKGVRATVKVKPTS